MVDVNRDGAVNATDIDEIAKEIRRNPEILAEWATDSHIQRTPRKGPEDDTLQPPTPS